MEDNIKSKIKEALNLLSKERVDTSGLGAQFKMLTPYL